MKSYWTSNSKSFLFYLSLVSWLFPTLSDPIVATATALEDPHVHRLHGWGLTGKIPGQSSHSKLSVIILSLWTPKILICRQPSPQKSNLVSDSSHDFQDHHNTNPNLLKKSGTQEVSLDSLNTDVPSVIFVNKKLHCMHCKTIRKVMVPVTYENENENRLVRKTIKWRIWSPVCG